METWLPALESKQIIRDIACNIDHFNIMDDKSKINMLNAIISILTQKLLSLICINPPKFFKIHSSINNKQLVSHGYLRRNSPVYLPIDIMNIIIRYADYSLNWCIKDEIMTQFKQTKYRQKMRGPTLELNGFTFQLYVYPKGRKQAGYMGVYLQLIYKSDDIKRLQVAVTVHIKELDLIYSSSREFFKAKKGIGIDHLLLPIDKVTNLDCLDIECDVDIHHIEYKEETNLEALIFTAAPEIEDTEFIWNIDDELLQKFKNMNDNWVYWSDVFAENCLILVCGRWINKTELGLKLLKKPMGLDYYVVKIVWTVYYDNKRFISKEEEVMLKLGKTIWNLSDFLCENMNRINVLSFKIEIRIDDKNCNF